MQVTQVLQQMFEKCTKKRKRTALCMLSQNPEIKAIWDSRDAEVELLHKQHEEHEKRCEELRKQAKGICKEMWKEICDKLVAEGHELPDNPSLMEEDGVIFRIEEEPEDEDGDETDPEETEPEAAEKQA